MDSQDDAYFSFQCDTTGIASAKSAVQDMIKAIASATDAYDLLDDASDAAASAAKQHAQAVSGYSVAAVAATSAAKQFASQLSSGTTATQASTSATQSHASATQSQAAATTQATTVTQANTQAQQSNAQASSATTAQMDAQASAMSRHAVAQAKSSRSTQDASGSFKGFNHTLMVTAQTLDDLQYVGEQGLRPILNNLVQIHPALGIVAIGVDTIRKHTEELKTAAKALDEYWHFDKLAADAGEFGQAVKSVTGSIIEMGQTGMRWLNDLGDGWDAFLGRPAKRDKDAVKKFVESPTEADQERAKGVREAVGSMPHGLILGQLMDQRAKLSPDFARDAKDPAARNHEAARIAGVIERAQKADRSAMHELGVLSQGTEFGKELEKATRGKDAKKIAKELMPALGAAIGEGQDDATLLGIIKHGTPKAFPHERIERGAHEDALRIAKEQFDKDVGEHTKNGVPLGRARVEVREMYKAQRDKVKAKDEAKAAADQKELDENRDKEKKEFEDLQGKHMPKVALSQEARANIAKADRPGMNPKRKALLERLQAKEKAGTATRGDLLAISKLEEEHEKTDGAKEFSAGEADRMIQRQSYNQLIQQGVEPGEAERLANAAPEYYRKQHRDALNQLKAAKAVNPVDQKDTRSLYEKVMDPDGLNRIPDQGMFRDTRTRAQRILGDAPQFARPVANAGFHSMPIGAPSFASAQNVMQMRDSSPGGSADLIGDNTKVIAKNNELLKEITDLARNGIRTIAVLGD